MKTHLIIFTIFISFSTSHGQFEFFVTDSLPYVVSIDPTPTFVDPPTSTVVDSGLKVTFWIHGIAGNIQSWERVASVTETQSLNSIQGYPERNTISLVLDYSPIEGANNLDAVGANMALDMQSQLHSTQLDSLNENKNIAIAHSQGGVIGRAIRFMTETDYRYNESYGAMATFGSPHLGAQIVSSTVSNGPAQKWMTEGCRAIGNAEIQTFVNSVWALDALVHPSKITSFTNQRCDGLENTVLPTLLHSIRKPTAQDYAVDALPLAQLDSFARIDSMPVVTFFGIEEDPLVWRVAQSLTTTNDSVPSGSIIYANPFGLNSDGAMATFVNQKISSYAAKKESERSKAHRYHNLGIAAAVHLTWPAAIFYFDKKQKAKAKAEVYENAQSWLENANPTWKRLIGVRSDSTYTSGYVCECHLGYGQMHVSVVSDLTQCPPSNLQSYSSHNCITTPILGHTVVDEQSDGVVTVSSQRGYPGIKTGEARMQNTNHMQERNSSETRGRLNELFDGDYGWQFEIKEK